MFYLTFTSYTIWSNYTMHRTPIPLQISQAPPKNIFTPRRSPPSSGLAVREPMMWCETQGRTHVKEGKTFTVGVKLPIHKYPNTKQPPLSNIQINTVPLEIQSKPSCRSRHLRSWDHLTQNNSHGGSMGTNRKSV